MKKSIVGLSLLLFASLAWAIPTLQQVEAEIGQGHYAKAESMMAEVVADKPQSAKAHYIYAEVLAHNANFTKASTEAARARELDPAIKFTDAAKFNAFEQTLQREQKPVPRARPSSERTSAPNFSQAAIPAPSEGRTGIPGWVWLAGLALLAVVLWRGFSRSRAASPAPMAAPMAAAGVPAGYGPGGMVATGPAYGPGPYGQAPVQAAPGRSGMLGTGLAVAGGVAGGMLLDQMLHRRDGGGSGGDLSNNHNIGGFDPDGSRLSSADQAASDLENRSIDFGNGADWDSGGGSSDGGDSGGGWD